MKSNGTNDKLELFVTPQSYFQELVSRGLSSRKLSTSPHVETYLVKILNFYLDARNLHDDTYSDEQGSKNPKTYAEMFLHALNCDDFRKIELLRKIGDRTLYISGIFGDSLQRKIVDVDYYVNIGGSAYAALSQTTKNGELVNVYSTISQNFVDFVDVFTYVSHNSFIKSDQSVLRLYDRYMKTGSDLAREKLIELGVLTISQDQLKLGKLG